MRQLAPIVSTLTWFAKARTGKLKSIPQSILGEQRKPGSIAETSMMQRFQAVHIEASDAMFSIYMRKFDLPLRISILMDSMEKYGWDERNLKREFFAHGAIQLGSERSLKRGLSLLKSSMVESLRIGVELDYDVLKRICVTVQRWDMVVFGETCRKHLNLDRDPNSVGYESNCLALLEELTAVGMVFTDCKIQ